MIGVCNSLQKPNMLYMHLYMEYDYIWGKVSARFLFLSCPINSLNIYYHQAQRFLAHSVDFRVRRESQLMGKIYNEWERKKKDRNGIWRKYEFLYDRCRTNISMWCWLYMRRLKTVRRLTINFLGWHCGMINLEHYKKLVTGLDFVSCLAPFAISKWSKVQCHLFFNNYRTYIYIYI